MNIQAFQKMIFSSVFRYVTNTGMLEAVYKCQAAKVTLLINR